MEMAVISEQDVIEMITEAHLSNLFGKASYALKYRNLNLNIVNVFAPSIILLIKNRYVLAFTVFVRVVTLLYFHKMRTIFTKSAVNYEKIIAMRNFNIDSHFDLANSIKSETLVANSHKSTIDLIFN